MRALAGEMERLETLMSVEARRPDAVASLEQVREAEFNASYDDEEPERWAKVEELAPALESEGDDEETISKDEHEDEREAEFAVCAEYEVDGRRLPLDQSARQGCEAVFHELSAKGYRVLAVAYAEVAPKVDYGKEDERQLVFVCTRASSKGGRRSGT
jgi:magnesium-transporting ATPase (P-type)